MKDAGEIQPQHREQAGQRGHQPGILQLEAPAQLLPSRTQHQQQTSQSRKTQHDTRGIGQAAHTLLPRAVRMAGKTHHLDRQHRKHAGHQVQQQAAQQGASQRQPERHAGSAIGGRRLCGLRIGTQGRSQFGRHLGRALRCRPGTGHRRFGAIRRSCCIAHHAIRIHLSTQRQHHRQVVGAFHAHIVQRQFDLPALAIPALFASGGRSDDFGRFRVQVQHLALPAFGQGLAAENDVFALCIHAGPQHCISSGQRLRNRLQGCVKRDRIGGQRLASGQLERELALLRNALLLAGQPVGLQFDLDRTRWRTSLGQGDRHRQQHSAVVSIVGQRAHWQLGRRRPGNVAGLHTSRQRPAQAGGLSAVAGVLPVCMPVGGVGELQAQPQRLAGLHPFWRMCQQTGFHLFGADLMGCRSEPAKARAALGQSRIGSQTRHQGQCRGTTPAQQGLRVPCDCHSGKTYSHHAGIRRPRQGLCSLP